MKKIIFLFALFASIAANAAVTVTPLGVNYGTKTVTFRVSWEGTATDRVWVWVDYCSVAGTSPGTFAKAVISAATAASGSIDAASLNGRGFYVTASPSTVTATLSNATGKFNWCVYGSDTPPNVTAADGIYTLYGTPPFILTAADDSTTQTVAASTIATSSVTITPVTLTDETGCPGIFCIYTGSDLYIDGTHLCQQRATGAQNWEAWIKDTRDNELYRIVLMPDDKWWLAQNVKYAGAGTAHSSCKKDECGRYYSRSEANKAYESGTGGADINTQGVCPYDWLLPISTDWTFLHVSLGNDAATTLAALRALDSQCTPVYDTYGWATKVHPPKTTNGWCSAACGYYQNNLGNPHSGLMLDAQCPSICEWSCNKFRVAGNGTALRNAMVRCFRIL